MKDTISPDEILKSHPEIAKELEDILRLILEEGDDNISKNDLLIAGIFAKLDIMISEVSAIKEIMRNLDSRLNIDPRVATWLKTFQ